MINAIDRLLGGGMFGLSNNKQDNQDDQVMLKNVSKLATDLSNPSSQTSSSPAQPVQQSDDTVTRSGFPASSTPTQQGVQSDQVQSDVTTMQPDEQPVSAPQTNNDQPFSEDAPDASSPATPPSSFSFPDTSGLSADESSSSNDEPSPAAEETESPSDTSRDLDVVSEATMDEQTPNTQFEQPNNDESGVVQAPVVDEQQEAVETPSPSQEPVDSDEVNQDTPAAPLSAPIDAEKLQAMKQQAMEHLDPLVDHLDQTPEETFKTTMMMIQANDNHHLLDKALDAAKRITDDKERAQAMLDIINEINYFSQGATDENPAS